MEDSSQKEIHVQLNSILDSNLFSRSSVLSKFLKFIVEETLKGNSDGLKEYTIAINALEKKPDFNPQIDAIVRIHAGRLRRLLNEYYTGLGKNDLIKIELVKGTYVPVFRANLINEPTPIEKEEFKPNQHLRSKLTLAVLPFRNLCADNEYQFFADGFGEELTRIFSIFEDIAVIAHHSARKYAAIQEDVRIIGTHLGAHYLINGSVKRTVTEIRVSVGLIETLNGTLVWSKNYAHVLEKNEIIDIQDQICTDVFSMLSGLYGFIIRDSMGGKQNVMTQNLDGFTAILWNYHAQMTHAIEACTMSRKALEKAVENDGTNVTCLTSLGELYINMHLLGYPSVEDPINEAGRLIQKAIKLAPLCQNAHMVFGWVNVCLGKKEEAIKALEYSIQLAPLSASASGDVAFCLICAGEYKKSHVLLQQSLDLNPYCPWFIYMAFFLIYYQKENYEEALLYAEKMQASEDVFLDPLLITAAKGQLGLISEAQKEIKILNEKFQPFLTDLNIHLEAFLLDQNLVNNILKGVIKAGLEVHLKPEKLNAIF